MPRLTAGQLYQVNRQAGFDPAGAVVMAAIQLAESSGTYGNLADLQAALAGRLKPGSYPGLAYWPSGSAAGGVEISIGTSQINYSAHRGIDPVRAMMDPLYNAREAHRISGGGKNFRPWTTFTKGLHRKHLSTVQAAAGEPVQLPTFAGGPDLPDLPDLPGPLPNLPNLPKLPGLPSLPDGLGGDVAKGIINGVGRLLQPLGDLAIRGALVFFGAVFIIVALLVVVNKASGGELAQQAGTAAKAAAA